ncbi:hypothetical protein [Streptobacillus moniliformis]|uniref:hypothetical protein n=1 Tax=Streptobacillus moniliformis TaxID=34105 RepID=UPI0007E33DB6|nr:hypothetical protein [Streptobacillus moniliformis]
MNKKHNLFVDLKGELHIEDKIYTKRKLKYLLSFSKDSLEDLARFIINALNYDTEYILHKLTKVEDFDKMDIRKLTTQIDKAINERQQVMIDRKRDFLIASGDYLRKREKKKMKERGK